MREVKWFDECMHLVQYGEKHLGWLPCNYSPQGNSNQLSALEQTGFLMRQWNLRDPQFHPHQLVISLMSSKGKVVPFVLLLPPHLAQVFPLRVVHHPSHRVLHVELDNSEPSHPVLDHLDMDHRDHAVVSLTPATKDHHNNMDRHRIVAHILDLLRWPTWEPDGIPDCLDYGVAWCPLYALLPRLNKMGTSPNPAPHSELKLPQSPPPNPLILQ